VGHDGDRPWSKNVLMDELRPYDREPRAWGDMVAELVDGDDPPPFARQQWPAPAAAAFNPPRAPYAVLHVGASSALKRWPAGRWLDLASHLEGRGMAVAWSGDAHDAALVRSIDPSGRYASYAGQLDLAQMWHLLAGAALLVAPDTGIAHLGRVVMRPTVALFGPGSATLCAPGTFWANAPWRAVGVDPFPCRDQRLLFRREVDWVRRCARTTDECEEPRCMNAIPVDEVIRAIDELLRQNA
jgi:ADP-heptose:LPS heptosyltransferase